MTILNKEKNTYGVGVLDVPSQYSVCASPVCEMPAWASNVKHVLRVQVMVPNLSLMRPVVVPYPVLLYQLVMCENAMQTSHS